MTREEIERILTYCERATEGPWGHSVDKSKFVTASPDRGPASRDVCRLDSASHAEDWWNYHFVSNARSDLPKLARRCIELQELLDITTNQLKLERANKKLELGIARMNLEQERQNTGRLSSDIEKLKLERSKKQLELERVKKLELYKRESIYDRSFTDTLLDQLDRVDAALRGQGSNDDNNDSGNWAGDDPAAQARKYVVGGKAVEDAAACSAGDSGQCSDEVMGAEEGAGGHSGEVLEDIRDYQGNVETAAIDADEGIESGEQFEVMQIEDISDEGAFDSVNDAGVAEDAAEASCGVADDACDTATVGEYDSGAEVDSSADNAGSDEGGHSIDDVRENTANDHQDKIGLSDAAQAVSSFLGNHNAMVEDNVARPSYYGDDDEGTMSIDDMLDELDKTEASLHSWTQSDSTDRYGRFGDNISKAQKAKLAGEFLMPADNGGGEKIGDQNGHLNSSEQVGSGDSQVAGA